MGLLVKAVGGYWEAGCADAFANKPALTCTNFEVMVFFTPFTLSS